MPMKTPQGKKPVVTCCSHSHGACSSRVTTSRNTEPVKPMIDTPHRTIRPASTGSSAFHFRCRWRGRTRLRLLTGTRGRSAVRRSLHVANEVEDLDGVRPELLGEAVLDRLGVVGKPGLVDVVDDLYAHLLELLGRVLLELQGLGGLGLGDL